MFGALFMTEWCLTFISLRLLLLCLLENHFELFVVPVCVWTHGCPSGVFSGMAMVKEVLENCGGRAPATTEITAGALRLPSRSAATTVSRYSLSCCRGSPVVRTWPFFLSTSKRPSPPARKSNILLLLLSWWLLLLWSYDVSLLNQTTAKMGGTSSLIMDKIIGFNGRSTNHWQNGEIKW